MTDTEVKSEKEPTAPRNVSKHAWERFKELEKRTDEVTRKSREKRIKDLQKDVLTKVTKEIQDDDGKEILRKYDVKFGPSIHEKTEIKEQNKTSTNEGRNEEKWKKVKELIDINKHIPGNINPAESRLEKTIDTAILKGDIKKAEELSDKLANREFGKKVAEAVDAREFLKRKKIEEDSLKQKKSKKLHWGFQEKERWETKGNM